MNNFELILSRHQNLFIETSSILYESLNNVAMLKEFHIVLPPSWNRSDCNRNFTSMAPAEADVRIESGHPVYGNRPWTQQTRDCGQQLHFRAITFPSAVRSSRKIPPWAEEVT